MDLLCVWLFSCTFLSFLLLPQNLDALSADQDTYFYTVPTLNSLVNAGVNDTIMLNFSLLKTLVGASVYVHV